MTEDPLSKNAFHFTVKMFVHCRPLKTKKKLHSTAFLSLKNGNPVHRTTIHGKSSTTKVCKNLIL